MNYIYPYVDVRNVDQGAVCYSFYDNYLVAFNQDFTTSVYILQNDKFYSTYVDRVFNYSNANCMSYNDVSTMIAGSYQLAPFYCFLSVVIFGFLIFIPYKIFIRPFFHKL